jgi:hypothetical protein
MGVVVGQVVKHWYRHGGHKTGHGSKSKGLVKEDIFVEK